MATLPKSAIKKLPLVLRRENWVAGNAEASANVLVYDTGLVKIEIKTEFNTKEDAETYLKDRGFRLITGTNTYPDRVR